MTLKALGFAAVAALLATTSLSAQNISTSTPPGANAGGAIPPASGGAGDRTGSITATGQTKPPGDPVGEGMGTRPDLERKSREIDERIRTGICKGC